MSEMVQRAAMRLSKQSNSLSGSESEFLPLFVSDAELIRRLGVGDKTARAAIKVLERRGFPRKDPLFGDKRYWPAIRRFFDEYFGLSTEKALPLAPDGNERWPNGDGTVKVRSPDRRVWVEDAKPTDPASWRKKRELKPRKP